VREHVILTILNDEDCPHPRREGCCTGLLRVTADDIRQRYSAPVSGIVAPQCVSNVRIVAKL